MYELLKLIHFAERKSANAKLVLATIIHTIGSSYRKTGTQMLVADDLSYEGALSGGCVEKEVLRHAQQIFADGRRVVFEYDGRYKLGCNGRIFILVELTEAEKIAEVFAKAKHFHLSRRSFALEIERNEDCTEGSIMFNFDEERLSVGKHDGKLLDCHFVHAVPPQDQLVIIGGEYDSVTLANAAVLTGMQTIVVVKEKFSYPVFDNVSVVYANPDELLQKITFDNLTAIVIMTHSLSKDLSWLMELVKVPSCYLGVLGPAARKDALLNEFMNRNDNLFLEHQHRLAELKGPIGLSIGAKTPEEISIAILGEVIASLSRSKVVHRSTAIETSAL